MTRDNAPAPHTCPMIDEVIRAINSVEWKDSYWSKNELFELTEDIRSANSTLRSWGNEQYDECENLKDKIYDLENDLKCKNKEIENLINRIKELENKIHEI